jgi:transposase-like protein
LTEVQRSAAVALFEQGWGDSAVATRLGVRRWPVRSLYRRWSVHGMGALVGKPTKSTYPFEFKLDVVRTVLDGGVTADQLARQHGLSSAKLVQSWVRAYRRHGEEGLKPKPKGRPPGGGSPPTPGEMSDLQRLEHENLRLRAENAYLKKLQALRVQGRR